MMRNLTCCFLILGLLFIISCRDANSVVAEKTQDSMQSNELNRMGSETGLFFPVESKVIHFSAPERFVDPVWVAKVLMPASSYEVFQEAVLGKTTDNTVYHGALADSTSWWKPTDVVLKKQYLADRQTFVNVVVSKDAEEFAVYIECVVH